MSKHKTKVSIIIIEELLVYFLRFNVISDVFHYIRTGRHSVKYSACCKILAHYEIFSMYTVTRHV